MSYGMIKQRSRAARGPLPRGTVTLVCGPPCAGKNTYVDQHRRPGDLVLDFDALITALGGAGDHTVPEQLKPYAYDARDAVLERLLNRPTPVRAAWIILCAPTAAERRRYRAQGARVVLLNTDQATCLERAAAHRPPEFAGHVLEWFDTYEPGQADEIVVPSRTAPL
ncbi:hypothetical protein IMZ11_33800 [Microtetraspora sp. AC03309]|uniref:ATP-binding protein n=1 Tax=Microtetraspora sp. AC03309 TaxID=2779376 RepID=UPI001E60C451|nr:ATP-binding protein [Microtetraspora sp. AC03309]MCC5580604.1 hypothetical protein [Microtetraspora sp. AC03309]